MDDTKPFVKMLLGFAVALAGIGARAEGPRIHYIDPIERQVLSQTFNDAPKTDIAVMARAVDRAWECDMNGMATNMRVQPKVNLYRFRYSEQHWGNLGAMPVKSYTIVDGALVGDGPKGRDRVRMTRRGQLISQFTSQPDNVVRAYSICHPI